MKIPFNLSKKFDFLPQLSFPGCEEPLEVIYQTKLLGVTLSRDLSWLAHINNITKRTTKKLWVILRFKTLGGTRERFLSLYQLCMEMVHMVAIILGLGYRSYESALDTFK